MSFNERLPVIAEIERLRSSRVLCYLTSLRPNVLANISEDAVRVMFDHLLALPSRPVPRLDLYLCSNGGSAVLPWRIVTLLREFAREVNVLVPYRAYSAATMIALGADQIVMHPFAELGPIDPTVSNDFNPVDQGNRRLGISVEDVRAYIDFIKTTVGITHEDELVHMIQALIDKVHPLALGNVERFLSQTRMTARKIMKTHMSDADEHQIDTIVETMVSKLYFHGHPINRVEARTDLRLKVAAELPPELEKAMWRLYLDFEDEFQNRERFLPQAELLRAMDATAQAGQPAPPGKAKKEFELLHAVMESRALSSRYCTTRRYVLAGFGQNQEPLMREELLEEGWRHTRGPAATA